MGTGTDARFKLVAKACNVGGFGRVNRAVRVAGQAVEPVELPPCRSMNAKPSVKVILVGSDSAITFEVIIDARGLRCLQTYLKQRNRQANNPADRPGNGAVIWHFSIG
jgi:hypothetical protein